MFQFPKIKKALLITPPTGRYMRDPRCQAPVDTRVAEPPRPPMDLAYIAAVLENCGIECVIRDYPAEKKTIFDFRRDILELRPDMITITTALPTLDYDLESLIVAKEIDRKIVTIAKGPHLFCFDEEILRGIDNIDFIVWDESPFVFKELLKEEPSKINGITFRHNGAILKNKKRVPLDIDKLPFPARHLLNNRLYRTPDTDDPIAFIMVGRGCPYRCIFCNSGVVYGYEPKNRDINSIINEIEQCIRDFGIRNFFFKSETFTLNKEWMISLCKEIIDSKLNIRWATNSRVDTIDEERLFWMKKAGCSVIGFGAESGSQEILDRLDKNISLKQTEKAVSICRHFGIESFLIFVIGFPWDTKKTLKETMYFIRRIEPSFIEVNITYPFIGTPLYNMVKEYNLLGEKRLTGFDYSNPVIKTFELSSRDLIKFRKKILRNFYLRRSYVINTIKKMKSLKVFLNYMRWALKFVLKNV